MSLIIGHAMAPVSVSSGDSTSSGDTDSAHDDGAADDEEHADGEDDHDHAEEDAHDVIGVSRVTNLLTVKAAGRDDDAIRDDLQFEFRSDYALNIYAIRVSVKDGFVTLSGIVNSIYDKKRAGIIASRVLGVKDVVNNIVVSSGSACNYESTEVHT